MSDSEDRDPLELDTIFITTGQHLRERGMIDPPGLLGVMVRRDYEMFPVEFERLADLATFLGEMTPRVVRFQVGRDESEQDLRDAIACAAMGALH